MTEPTQSTFQPQPPAQPRIPVQPLGGAMPPPPPYPPPYPPPPCAVPRRGGLLGRVFGWSLTGAIVSLLLVSLVFNVYQGVILNSFTSGPHEVPYEPGTTAGRIVILPIEGLIDDSTAELVRRSLQRLEAHRPHAVVLRVDSPGGIPGPCDRIYQHVRQFRTRTGIPVVGSFGSVAASGGYYVAAGCDWIVAEPTCITGSIGVLSQAFTVERLLDKIGVSPEVRAASGSPEKDVANNMFRPWNEQDRRVQQVEIDHLHDRFVEVVFEGRRAQLQTIEQARALGNGRIYVSGEALANKLVDAQGYLADAIQKAKELTSLAATDQPEVTIMRPPAGFGLLGMLSSRQQAPAISAEHVRRLLVELSAPRLEYR